MENKFNKDFEDFGWLEMQKMLDRELSVADKKRRRGLVFWLFLAVGVTAFGIYQFNNSNLVNNEVKNNKPVVIHCVKAYNELILLKKKLKPKVPWVVHGFNQNEQILNALLKNDFFIFSIF